MAGGIGKQIVIYKDQTLLSPSIGTSMCLLYDGGYILGATALHVVELAGADPVNCIVGDTSIAEPLHKEFDNTNAATWGMGDASLDVCFYGIENSIGFDSSDFHVPIPGQDGVQDEPILGSGRESALVPGSDVYVAYTDSNGIRGAERGQVSEITEARIFVTGLALAWPGCSGGPLFIWHGGNHKGCCLVGMLEGGTCNFDDPKGIAFIRYSVLRACYEQQFPDSKLGILTPDVLRHSFQDRSYSP